MRKLATVAALAVVALAVRRWVSSRDAMAAVRSELRSPLLPFLPSVGSARMLPVHRFVARVHTSPGPGVSVVERRVGEPSVRVLVVTPVEQAPLRPGLLWIHSGGLVVGSPQLELSVVGPIARELGAVAVAPDYRLAPEHPFPAALDDCMTALTWMRSHGRDLGIDSDRIAVAGPSAGGGLSAATAQRCHDEGIPLRAQVLIYPMLDDRITLLDDHAERRHFVWTPRANRFGWASYLGREPSTSDAPEYAVPARRTDVSGLPPAWIGVGELDLLYDEAVAYAERLIASGVSCELLTVPGMYHGADGVASKAESVLAFRCSMIEYLRAHF